MKTPSLPHGLRIIADAAGIDAAMTLALEKGGTRIEIPKRAEGSQLAEIVGIDAAHKIVASLATERFEVPLAKKVLNAWLRDDQKLKSQEKRAQRLKCSRRTIQKYDAGQAKSPQLDFLDTIGA